MICKNCGSTRTVKAGKYRNRKGLFQKWKCNDCGFVAKGGRLS